MDRPSPLGLKWSVGLWVYLKPNRVASVKGNRKRKKKNLGKHSKECALVVEEGNSGLSKVGNVG